MQPIEFCLKAVPIEEQERTIGLVRSLQGVKKALRLRPHSRNESVTRICYAYLDESAYIELMRVSIACLDNVEYAKITPLVNLNEQKA